MRRTGRIAVIAVIFVVAVIIVTAGGTMRKRTREGKPGWVRAWCAGKKRPDFTRP
jgi:hypothetical protein